MGERPASWEEQARDTYREMESRTADAWEGVVKRDAFGELLARTTENVMALTRIGWDAMDLVVRNLRLAGRRDVNRLGAQLARTEDKLEMVLQEVERLRDEQRPAPRQRSSNGGNGRRRSTREGRSR